MSSAAVILKIQIVGGGLLLLLTLFHLITNILAAEIKCIYASPLGMDGADCSDRGLRIVPKNLRTSIQVLDLSRNHIQVITNDSFTSYTSIRLLYLQESRVKKIEAMAFYPLSNLGVLDLSSNPLRKFDAYCPPSVYRLYLADMSLDNISISSITSLQHLSLADCYMENFPQLGLIPTLVELNLTGNPLNTISTVDLAPFCHLKMLYVTPDTLFKTESDDALCECLRLEKWTSTHGIKVDSFTCKLEKGNATNLDYCDMEFDNITDNRRKLCLSSIQYAQQRNNSAVVNEIVLIALPLFLSALFLRVLQF